jgi:CDP-diacylglycerol---serine O-phosphatidyltransferase
MRHLPNFITLLNLLSGCIAMVFVGIENYELAFYFVCLGIFFDFFDGFFARLLKVSSSLGVQLDSLADMVTSSVVPGYVMFRLIFEKQNEGISVLDDFFPINHLLPLAGFLITLGAAYRLAKFNIDTRQTNGFLGLPTPANALFIMSLPLVLQQYDTGWMYELLSNSYVLIALSILSALIMNVDIPLFSLKISKERNSSLILSLVLLVIAVSLYFTIGLLAIPLTIICYILLSLFFYRPNNAS